MVALDTIQEANAQLKEAPKDLVALFLGATSGIGQATLREFAKYAVKPRVFIVARNAAAAAPFVKELSRVNPGAKFEVIERNVSLLSETHKMIEEVKAKVDRIDLLFMSVGFFSLDGRHDTSEGLEATFTTRYYSRMRTAQLLLPLLNAAPKPRVVSVLCGGLEAPIDEKDLDLTGPKAFSTGAGNNHVTTMTTLTMEHLARENPHITFVHTHPGIVATTLLKKVSSGFTGFLLRYVATPLAKLFAMSVTESGQRHLFYATNARYGNDGGLVPLPKGLEVAAKSKEGVFLVDPKGEIVDSEKLLSDLRERGVGELVWDHAQKVYAANP